MIHLNKETNVAFRIVEIILTVYMLNPIIYLYLFTPMLLIFLLIQLKIIDVSRPNRYKLLNPISTPYLYFIFFLLQILTTAFDMVTSGWELNLEYWIRHYSPSLIFFLGFIALLDRVRSKPDLFVFSIVLSFFTIFLYTVPRYKSVPLIQDVKFYYFQNVQLISIVVLYVFLARKKYYDDIHTSVKDKSKRSYA